MDEIYQLVRIRISKVHELNKVLSTQNEQLKVEDIRKAKEDEKFRTEKENWILNVLKALKDYTFEQKQILCEKSLDIMKLIWPEFQLKSTLQYDEDFNKRFLDIYLKIFTEFFSPFEQAYEFRLTLRQVARSNNISIVPDMLKYLVEFSRDYFKKFMIYLSIQRNKQTGSNQQGGIQQTQNSQNNNQNSINNQNNTYQPTKQNQRSKSQIPCTNYSDNQHSSLKIQLSKVGAVIQNNINETENKISQLSSKAESYDNNNNIILKKKSISLTKQNEDIKLIGNILKQFNDDQAQQQIPKTDLIYAKEEEQQKENELSCKNSVKDNYIDFKEIQNSKQVNNENENKRRKSLLAKQVQQQASSPLKLIQNKKSIPTEGPFQDEKISPRQTPMNISNARSPLRQRLNNQGNPSTQQVQSNLIYNPSIKKSDLSVFPSTLQISWFVSKEKEMKITKQTNVNSVISDIDFSNIQTFNEKMKRAKGVDDIKLVYIQIYEQSKQRNLYINSTVQNYNDKYRNKFPKKIKQVNEERDKEDRELYANTIYQSSIFQQYFFSQNEDLLNFQKKGDLGNFSQVATQKMFIVKSAATKNRKYNSQVLTPPPSYIQNSTLYMNSSQKTNNSINVNNQITNQQQISNNATPLQQASQSINSQQNQILNNNIYNNSNVSKPKTVSCLNQVQTYSSTVQQQQRAFSPSKYHKIDHTNLQNKLKIIRLTNSRCNSALMRPKISQNNQNLETNNLVPIETLNNFEEKQTEIIPNSCHEIKISQRNCDQSTTDQSQTLRQKSNSVLHTNKQSTDIQQSFLGDTILQTQQSRNDYCIQGTDFIIKTQSFQELDDEVDDKKFNEENSVMEASFCQQNTNSKQNSTKKIGNVINIQDENEQGQIYVTNKTPNSDNNFKNQSESVIKQKLDKFLDQDLDYDESPQSPTSESAACYFVFSKKKKKSSKKVNDQDTGQNKRAQSQQSQVVTTILKEFNSSPQQNHLKMNKTQKISFKYQNSFQSVNQAYPIIRDFDQMNSKGQQAQQQQLQAQEKIEESEQNKQNQKRESAEVSSCSSTNSQNNQNLQQQNQKNNNKYQMSQTQANNLNGNNFNYNEIFVAQQQNQSNRLPQINQSNNNISKLNYFQQNGNEIKILQQNEEEIQKSRMRNYQNQPYIKKTQDYSNMLANNPNQNLQKEYSLVNNQFSNNNITNSQFSSQLQQLTYQSNKNGLYNNINYQYQQPEDQMKINYPQNLNVMTDKFKNLLLQKINKIKGEKQQQATEQNGNNQNGVMGGTNGIPLKILQQTQMQNSILQQPQNAQAFSVSQSKILQKYPNNINQQNTNSISSTQPSRINNFSQQQAIQNQDNSKSRPPSNNQLDSDMKQLNQISNTVPIRKTKNISFSVDNQGQTFMQNNQNKVNNQKIAQQINTINSNNVNQLITNQEQIQQLVIQPKNSSKDIFISTQSRQKYQQNSFSNTSKKMNPQKNYSAIQNQQTIQAVQQLVMNVNFTNNTQNTQLKAGQNALQNLIGQSNMNIQKTNNCFNMKLLKVQGNTINNDKKQEGLVEKGFKSIQQDINKQFTTSLVTQLQPFFQQHLIQQQK
ncbi:hypothetical protein TTHERM_00522890 (macronuclear) [Tetrahymena thermophila SB210]|uniref:Uncharacterized protein n=1 Tax=Tetrahymena thermophila (strain SB210) TaxID=312017 RepID=I7M146_TETTS|nr:hypothetical protein TTHERM_00522890 [Tetrahymena thermophila SB210]EAR94222.1 hypothetical protein TTHERM_00522890 [Tetrahymena thermophila SB210]|eukprot:XP_001014467.1 hypothetical protein TTHERM_00522890 [Tetrahymena thermophila SB210]